MLFIGDVSALPKTAKKHMKQALEAATLFWHKKDLPDHFKQSARHKYGYKKRSNKYKKRKRKTGHGILDLVYTGAMKRSALRYMEVKSSSKKAVGKMLVPKYAYVRAGVTAVNQPNNMAEMTKILPNEHTDTVSVVEDTLVKLINKDTTRRSSVNF